jgi:hypothetical protein
MLDFVGEMAVFALGHLFSRRPSDDASLLDVSSRQLI